ncbi:MAG TPA: hypothetical protein VK348_07740 [Planctomycetota bacterium]|nr:hypothetical protein [Planctomycetota bacterium]
MTDPERQLVRVNGATTPALMGRRTAILSLVCLALLVALTGARQAIVERGRIDVVVVLVVCSGMALACVYDARRLGRPLPGIAPSAILFAWPIAVPAYLVWSRGWKRGMLQAMAFLVALAVLLYGSFFAAGYAVWGAAFFETR